MVLEYFGGLATGNYGCYILMNIIRFSGGKILVHFRKESEKLPSL
jgi:hypothetical protein